MSAGFTPPPWLVEDTRGRANNLLRIVDEKGRGVARINATLHAAANASLIAAAPELYEALDWALRELNGRNRYDEDVADQQIDNCYDIANAALARARGETPSNGEAK